MFYCYVYFLNKNRERVFKDCFTLNMSRDKAYKQVREKAWKTIRERAKQPVRDSETPVTFEIEEHR